MGGVTVSNDEGQTVHIPSPYRYYAPLLRIPGRTLGFGNLTSTRGGHLAYVQYWDSCTV